MDSRRRLEHAGDHAAIQLEPEIDSDRADGRLVAQPEPVAAAQFSHVELVHPPEDVAAVEEDDAADILPDRKAQLAIEEHDGVTAGREAVGTDRVRGADAVEREAANRRVAAGEESLAGRQVIDGDGR